MFKPSNKPNNRFNFLADELKSCTSKTPTKSADLNDKGNSYHALEECKGVKPETNSKKNVKVDVKVNNKENTFLTSTSNSRFDMAKLTDESYLDTMNTRDTNTRDNYSRNSKNLFNNMSKLPDKPHVIPFEYKEESFPELTTTNKDNVIKEQIITESAYKNAIKKENVVIEDPETQTNTEQNVKIVVEMGLVLITRDKFGKKVAIYGPKSEEQKRRHFLENDLNHQMNLSILRMEERWTRYKQIYDDNHGQNAFEEKYGYEPVYDESYEDENDDSESDYESDYESE
jgi:hypothetical protein